MAKLSPQELARACQDIKHEFLDDHGDHDQPTSYYGLAGKARISPSKRRPATKPHRFNYDSPVRLNKLHTIGHQESILVYEPIKRSTSRTGMPNSKLTLATLHQVFATSALLAILLQSTSVTCDTSLGSHGEKTLANQHTIAAAASRAKPATLSSSKAASQRERLLASLAESIERQHLGSHSAALAPGYLQPSRFHTLQDIHESHIDSSKMHSSPVSPSVGSPTKRKAEDSMRSVLMMHEMAMRASTATPPRATQGQKEVLANRIKSSQGAGRLIEQVVSLIPPLVGFNKASDPRVLSASKPNVTGTRGKLHQFVARSNNGPITFGLNQLNKRLVSADSGGSSKPVTEAPLTAFLAKPILGQLNDIMQQFGPTPQSVTFNSNSKCTEPNNCPDHQSSPSETSSSSIDAMINGIPVNTQKEPNLLKEKATTPVSASSWLKNSANQIAQSYLHDTFRGLLTMSQLPILSANPISTAPSIHECVAGKCKTGQTLGSGGPMDVTSSATSNLNRLQNKRRRAIDELYRYAYLVGSGVRRKRDPLKALSSASSPSALASFTSRRRSIFAHQKSNNQQQIADSDANSLANVALKLIRASGQSSKRARPRGVMWDMATDPTLAVTLFHLLERASLALPLGFLLMPFVKTVSGPLSGGFNLGSILPARASHRSVDYEELIKRLDNVDKMFSRALRPAHRALK